MLKLFDVLIRRALEWIGMSNARLDFRCEISDLFALLSACKLGTRKLKEQDGSPSQGTHRATQASSDIVVALCIK